MGYPMTYERILWRHAALGSYESVRAQAGPVLWLSEEMNMALRMLGGDLRRLEADSCDGGVETQRIAAAAGVDIETVIRVLAAFFAGAPTTGGSSHAQGT